MLDAYIIDRIRREQERGQRKDAFVPLHIESPPPERRPRREEPDPEQPKRGSIVIDFQV